MHGAGDAPDTTSRLAGGVVAAVGVLNLVIASLALTTGFVRVSAGVTGGFIALGLAFTAAGALVWRGNRAAILTTFAVVLALFVLQVTQLITDPGDPAVAAAVGDQPAGRVVVLSLLVVTLGAAAWRRRRTTSRTAEVS